MSICFANISLSPPVLLAPLAGITDLPFRKLVSSFGAGLVVSEMVASQEMVQAKPGVREKAELGFCESQTSVQLAGREAYWMAEAARMVEANGAALIDINMGCPAKKVTSSSGSGASGSALMQDLDHALTLIDAVVEAVSIPVTLKCRLGWNDETRNAPDLAKRAESAGIQMLTVHGRTRCQFYKGRADWNAIRAVKDNVSIPVIANGDIVDSRSAAASMDASGADGVMIGRGAQGQPWLPAQIAADLFGNTRPETPRGAALAELVVTHYTAMLSFYGVELGKRVARKHLGWYLDMAGDPVGLRRRILTESGPAQVQKLVVEALAATCAEAA